VGRKAGKIYPTAPRHVKNELEQPGELSADPIQRHQGYLATYSRFGNRLVNSAKVLKFLQAVASMGNIKLPKSKEFRRNLL